MDCKEFVKIGVSYNTEQRKNQIPCEINQYYCTEPMENAFEVERFMHKVFSPRSIDCEIGRECFDVDFQCACNVLKHAIKSTEEKRSQVESTVLKLNSQDPDKHKFDNGFYRFVSVVLASGEPDLELFLFVLKGLNARSYLKNKETADKAKKRELQEV